MAHYYDRQPEWLDMARAARPVLHRRRLAPVRTVRLAARPGAFQGWAMEEVAPGFDGETLEPGGEVTLDFGESVVGTLSFRVEQTDRPNDLPVRLRVTLAEVPLELAEPMPQGRLGPGVALSTAWRQEETALVGEVPGAVTLPRRASFRYVRIHWDEYVRHFSFRLVGAEADGISSAPFADPDMPAYVAPEERPLVRAAWRTLRNCMQSVFEDGPKRDRRLWLGDLRLQALANEVGFRDFALIRRCLLLLAGLAYADGRVPACVFDYAEPAGNGTYIVDYAALFGATLLDYFQASGDAETARTLYPVALRQAEQTAAALDGQARYRGTSWVFLDWKDGLEKDAALAGVVVYGLRRTALLSEALGSDDARRLRAMADDLARAARSTCWNEADQAVESGAARQVSHAGWAWWTLAGILCSAEAAAAFARLRERPDAVAPGGPYLTHHVVDALIECGMADEARSRIRSYWGAMIGAGLDTFPEVWDASDPRRSPYDSPLLNSYCHAWSCTPLWLLRKAHRTRHSSASAVGQA